MHKLLGGVLLVAGCIMPALEHLREVQREILRLEGLSIAMEELRRSLLRSAPTMEELLLEASHYTTEEIQAFFRSIRLERLEEQSFCQQWQNGAEKLLPKGRMQRSLMGLGSILGQCGLEEQCRCLQLAAEELNAGAKKKREALVQQKRLWLTLSASAGGLLVILLL